MILPRLILHIAALVLPFLAIWAFLQFGPTGHVDSGGWYLVRLGGGIAAAGAQLAVLALWPLFVRCATRGRLSWLVGMGMGLLTHILAGIAFTYYPGITSQPVPYAVLVWTGYTLLCVGWATLPLTAVVAYWVGKLIRREARDDVH